MRVQATECLVKNNKVLTSGNELRLREEGWGSAANIGKIIGLRQVSCGNSGNFIAFFFILFSCVISQRDSGHT